MGLATLWAFSAAAALFTLLLTLSQDWHLVAVLALLETAWVALIATYGLASVLTLELGFLFWAGAAMVFSAVELATSLLVFLAHAELHQRP